MAWQRFFRDIDKPRQITKSFRLPASMLADDTFGCHMTRVGGLLAFSDHLGNIDRLLSRLFPVQSFLARVQEICRVQPARVPGAVYLRTVCPTVRSFLFSARRLLLCVRNILTPVFKNIVKIIAALGGFKNVRCLYPCHMKWSKRDWLALSFVNRLESTDKWLVYINSAFWPGSI